MTLEVTAVRFGVVTVAEVRRNIHLPRPGGQVQLLVLSTDGGQARATVTLTSKRSGRGDHLAIACPLCQQGKNKLYPTKTGGLGCAACCRHRTRRQAERTYRSWNQLGGADEDALLRRLRQGHPIGRPLPEGLREEAARLHRMDLARWADLRQVTEDALAVAALRDEATIDWGQQGGISARDLLAHSGWRPLHEAAGQADALLGELLHEDRS